MSDFGLLCQSLVCYNESGFKRQKDLRRCEYNFGVGVLHQVVFIFSLREVRANMKFLS